MSKNLFAVDIELLNITFLKNEEITPVAGILNMVPQIKFSKIKKLTMNNVKFENWKFYKGTGPFLFDE